MDRVHDSCWASSAIEEVQVILLDIEIGICIISILISFDDSDYAILSIVSTLN